MGGDEVPVGGGEFVDRCEISCHLLHRAELENIRSLLRRHDVDVDPMRGCGHHLLESSLSCISRSLRRERRQISLEFRQWTERKPADDGQEQACNHDWQRRFLEQLCDAFLRHR